MSWPYGIASQTVHPVFYEVLHARNYHLPSLRFPETVAKCQEQSNNFEVQRKPHWKEKVALYGVAIEIKQPFLDDLTDTKIFLTGRDFLL